MDGRTNEAVMVGGLVRVDAESAAANRLLFAQLAAARFIALDDTDATDKQVIEAFVGLTPSALAIVRGDPVGLELLKVVERSEEESEDCWCQQCGNPANDCACSARELP